MSVTFSGGITFTGGGFSFTAAPPAEATAGWYSGGTTTSSVDISTVQRITFATDTATASVRGPLSFARGYIAAAANFNYGWFAGGGYTTVDRITYASDTATASVRGPLNSARYGLAATGNTTDGWFGGGNPYPGQSTVQRITYATDTATASVRGPLSLARYYLAAAGNTTDGWFGGGRSASVPAGYTTVDRITYATDTDTASVRGPLSQARYSLAATGNDNYGWYGGGGITTGSSPTSRVDRITYATDTTTASVRGPLYIILDTYFLTATGNTTDGWFGGGAGYQSNVQRITYATDTATASLRGPLSVGVFQLASASGVQ